MYRKVVYFLYYLMFESQWKAEANEEETELEKMQPYKSELEEAGVFFDEACAMPGVPDAERRIFRMEVIAGGKYNRLDWEDDARLLEKIVDALSRDNITLGALFNKVKENIDAVVQEKSIEHRTEVHTALIDMKQLCSRRDDIWKDVVGCDGECPFCGARCEEDV